MTLVYQSFRKHDVPVWIQYCLKSVQDWTESRGYDYQFIDDELFEYAPDWYREKVQDNVQLVSDLSRLILAKRFLDQDYDRVIWMDADLLIFDPTKFAVDTTEGFYFCREIWMDADGEGNIVHQEKVNNSVSVFHRENALLDFYIDACLRLVETRQEIPNVLVGTNFLTALREIYPFPEITNVGIVSPALVHDLLTGNRDFLEKYLEWHGSAVFAANLCGSMQDRTFRGTEINSATMIKVVGKLLEQKKML